MKNKFNLTKKISYLLLFVIILVNIIPIASYALNYQGHEVTQFSYITIDGIGTDNKSYITTYVTDQTETTLTSTQLSTGAWKIIVDYDEDRWYFDGWVTNYEGYMHVPIVSDDEVCGENPIVDNQRIFYSYDQSQEYTKTSKYIYINHMGGMYGNYKLYAIFKPIVTVNAGDGVTYTISTPNSNKISDNKYGVKYKDDVTINYQIDSKYVLTSANASGTQSSDTSVYGKVTLTDTEKPTSVSINTRLKQQQVSFDANGGSGSMDEQTFSYGQSQTLATNSFTKYKHTFIGWNTEKEGTGDTYSHTDSVTFEPKSDGEKITLYAQWAPYPRADYTTLPSANSNLIYNGEEQELISAGNADKGTIVYSMELDKNFSEEIPIGMNAGDYNVYYYIQGNENYSDSTVDKIKVTINEANPEVIAPTANSNLTYNGAEQSLISAGSAVGGIMKYSLKEDGDYTTEIPTATNAGTYTVWYYVEGDNNHKDSSKQSVEVEIVKANAEIGEVKAGIVSDTTDISAIILERTDDKIDGNLSVKEGQTLELGDNEITYIFTPNDSVNYNVLEDKVNVTVIDTIAPTGTVTITDAKTVWDKILEKITFDIYFNTDQKIIVKAIDSFSGIDAIEYYESSKELDLNKLTAITDEEWKAIKNGEVDVPVEDAKQFIYYIRITDKSGNISYISTDGTEFDTTAPIISGVYNEKTYYTSQKITVTDKNLNSITLNEEEATDTIILEGNKEGIYEIVATDKVGNSTKVTVKMAKLDDITEVDSDTVTPEDKAELEDAKTELEKNLEKNSDIYSEDEKKAIEEEIKNIEESLEIIKNVEAVETIINNLPDEIKKVDTKEVEIAQKAYNKLSDYEKTLVDKDTMKKLDTAIKAVEEINKPINVPQTGDNILVYVVVLLISIVGIIYAIIKFRKKPKK